MTNDLKPIFCPQMNFNNLVEFDSAYSALLHASKNDWRRTPRSLLDVNVSQRKSRGTKIVSLLSKLLILPISNNKWVISCVIPATQPRALCNQTLYRARKYGLYVVC